MARYTCSVTVAVALANLYPNITELLKSCNLEVLIFREDYLMAREKPGQVPFTKLATVEILVDSTRSTMHAADFELVVKNEELPLQSNNHCRQVYQSILKKSAANPGWRLLSCSDQDFAVNVPAAEPQPSPSSPPVASSHDAAPAASAPPESAPPANGHPAPVSANAPLETTPPAPSESAAEPATFVVQDAQEQTAPSSSPQAAPDPSRFTSLPKVASRTSAAPASEPAVANGGTSQPSAKGTKLTWKPMSPDSPSSQVEMSKLVDPNASFEEFLAAGKSAESKTQPDHSSST